MFPVPLSSRNLPSMITASVEGVPDITLLKSSGVADLSDSVSSVNFSGFSRSENREKLKFNSIKKLKINYIKKLKINYIKKLKINYIKKLKINKIKKLKINSIKKLNRKLTYSIKQEGPDGPNSLT